MKKIISIIILILIVLMVCLYSKRHWEPVRDNKAINIHTNQIFLNKEQIINDLIKHTKFSKDEIIEKYIWVQYVNMDQDSNLELLISYRYGVHKGYFFIYDYENKNYKKVFSRPWAIEKMNGHEVIVASGSQVIHQLISYIIHMERGKVWTLWDAVIDKYDYSNPLSGIEIHGYYYVDTNAVLHYCYKIEDTDKDANILRREFEEQLYIWDELGNKYILKK